MPSRVVDAFEIFKKLINLNDPSIYINVAKKYDSSTVIIEESKNEATLTKAILKGLDGEHTFAFTLDVEAYRLSPFLNPSTAHINKVCDGVIVSIIENELIVYLCELKSKDPDPKQYILQFKNSEAFIRYLESLAQIFFNFNEKLTVICLLFDRKKSAYKTLTKGIKILPKKTMDIAIYEIHHLDANKGEFLNVRHLE